MAGRSAPSWRWRRWAPTALELVLVSPFVPLGGAAGNCGFVEVGRRVASPLQRVQALLPPEPPPPPAAETAGRGSEQAAMNRTQATRTKPENTPWVPSDLCPDIRPSQSENTHIAENARTNVWANVPFARDRPAH